MRYLRMKQKLEKEAQRVEKGQADLQLDPEVLNILKPSVATV